MVIDNLGEIESYKVIEPAQGWVSGTLQQGQFDGNQYWDQTGSVDINGNQTIKVRFHGPLKCVFAVDTSLAVYEMTINENDPTNQFPGQGSTGAADHTINNSYALLADQQLDKAPANIGIRIGGDGAAAMVTVTYGANLAMALAGLTVAEIELALRHVLNSKAGLEAYVDRKRVSQDYRR